jgi:hypothetical protein
MVKGLLLAFTLLVWSGCSTKKNPALVCDNGQCSDPHFPYCDLDGVIGGDPNTCIAVECAAGAFGACDGDNVLTCDGSGTGYNVQHCLNGCSAGAGGCNPCQANMMACGSNGALDACDGSGHNTETQCAAGCDDSPQPHCAYLQPQFLAADICDTPGQAALVITDNHTIDTAVDANCTGGIVPQSGGPGLCVVRLTSMSVASSATLRVIATLTSNEVGNSLDRPVAFVVDQDITIDGTLDASARGQTSGPGGGFSLAGGTDFMGSSIGLGGAGFATAGGNGGSYQADGGAQNGGPQLPNLLTSAIYVGGPQNIGGGGGAVMLVSCRGTVSVAGTISVGGGGGSSGYLVACTPGYGGGAGGSLLIQAMDIKLTGALYANGGGGGAGCVPNTQQTSQQDGQDASLSDTTPALGGTAVTGAGTGGKGGVGTSLPGDGRQAQMNVGHPGGGGGSVGWLETATPTGTAPTLTPAHVSPPLQPNATAATR